MTRIGLNPPSVALQVALSGLTFIIGCDGSQGDGKHPALLVAASHKTTQDTHGVIAWELYQPTKILGVNETETALVEFHIDVTREQNIAVEAVRPTRGVLRALADGRIIENTIDMGTIWLFGYIRDDLQSFELAGADKTPYLSCQDVYQNRRDACATGSALFRDGCEVAARTAYSACLLFEPGST